MRTISVLSIAHILFIAWCSYAQVPQSYVYKQHIGKDEVRHLYFDIFPYPEGYKMHLICTHNSDTVYTEYAQTDTNMAIMIWHYNEQAKNISIKGNRSVSSISFEGVFKGTSVSKTEIIDTLPWYQQFPFILMKPLKMSNKDNLSFWAVGVDDPRPLQAVKFCALKKDLERVAINNQIFNAVHVKISLTGIMAKLWHCDSWFDHDSFKYLRYKGKIAPLSPLVITELQQSQANDSAVYR